MKTKYKIHYLLLLSILFTILANGFYTSGNIEKSFIPGEAIEINNFSNCSPVNNNLILIINDEENDANSGGDAGNSLALATEITPGDYNGTLLLLDEDYYTFWVNSGVIINITMLPYNLTQDFDLTIFDPSFTPKSSNYKEAGIRETVIYSTSVEGYWCASILPNTLDQFGNYSFTLSLNSQNDFNSSKDAGNARISSLTISAGSSNGTFVWDSDIRDFYEISLNDGEIVDVTLQMENTTNLDLKLYSPKGDILKTSEKITGFDERIYYALDTKGIYNIEVYILEEPLNSNPIISYNLSILLEKQNDGNLGTDAGNNASSALKIFPLTSSIFNGRLVWDGDQHDYFTFSISDKSESFLILEVPDAVNFDLFLLDGEKNTIYSSEEESLGANEVIYIDSLLNDTYYLEVRFITGTPINGLIEGDYILRVSINPIQPTNTNTTNLRELIPLIISSILIPIFLIIILIFILYLFTDVRIPLISNRLDRYFSRDGSGETMKSLKYALKVRDDNIENLRNDSIDKDAKRAKDLEKIHRLEEDQKSKDKVLAALREENKDFKTRMDNLQAVNDDLANIIDSTLRKQLSRSSKPTQKVLVSSITSLLWLSEDRLKIYIDSISLLNERYILDRSRNHILTKEFAREIIRQAYWKRVGAMHLKKIKQVKVQSLAEDTDLDINSVKLILRELVERKEIPAPIHMDKVSLLLSISEELITEMTELAQTTPIISLKEISNSYDTTEESARIIFNKISEEGYVDGEFINEDIFVVFDLFANAIISEGSTDIYKFAEEHKMKDNVEEVRILIEKQLQAGKIKGMFLTDNLFLCFNNLNEQLNELLKTSIEDISRGDTRRVVFDIGSVVESVVKQSLIMDLHEYDDISKLTAYQEVIEARELGRIIRAAEEEKIALPAFVELKSINRYWAQKIKHTKLGELPYIPQVEEAQLFLFEANRALNKLHEQKLPTKWKLYIAKNLLKQKDEN